MSRKPIELGPLHGPCRCGRTLASLMAGLMECSDLLNERD